MNNESLAALALHVGRRLQSAGHSVVTAESCTAGWIAKTLTDPAGSSAWFDRGLVCYSNQAKMDLLGVPAAILDRHGAVSRETAEQMAAGALAQNRATISVAVTGIAGPDGGSDDKPVGTVWLAWAMAGSGGQRNINVVDVQLEQFSGDRDAVRYQTVVKALRGLLKQVDEA